MPRQCLLQRLLDVIIETGKDDLLDLLQVMQGIDHGFHRDMAGLVDRVAIDPAADRREGNTLALMLLGQQQALPVA